MNLAVVIFATAALYKARVRHKLELCGRERMSRVGKGEHNPITGSTVEFILGSLCTWGNEGGRGSMGTQVSMPLVFISVLKQIMFMIKGIIMPWLWRRQPTGKPWALLTYKALWSLLYSLSFEPLSGGQYNPSPYFVGEKLAFQRILSWIHTNHT